MRKQRSILNKLCTMGCTVATVKSNVNSETVAMTKNERVSENADTKDSKDRTKSIIADDRLQLTSRQKFQVLKSLKGVEREITVTGMKMFLRLFETNKDILQLFASFTGYNSVHELQKCSELQGHVTTVMHTIDEAISSFDDIDYVIRMLQSIGKLHRKKLKDFDPKQFWKIEEPFLVAVKETLGDRYTVNMDNIYKITIEFIIQSLIDGFSQS